MKNEIFRLIKIRIKQNNDYARIMRKTQFWRSFNWHLQPNKLSY